MYTLSLILSLLFYTSSFEMNIDFGKTKSGSKWIVINDGVMGGLSNSKAELLENSDLFNGNVSLENNGGFASLRSKYSKMDLSDSNTVTIRYKSKNQKVGLRLLKHEMYYMPYFKIYLPETNGMWKIITLPMSDFQEYRLESKTGKDLDKKDFEDIIRIGFIVSNKVEGPFEIEVDYINFN